MMDRAYRCSRQPGKPLRCALTCSDTAWLTTLTGCPNQVRVRDRGFPGAQPSPREVLAVVHTLRSAGIRAGSKIQGAAQMDVLEAAWRAGGCSVPDLEFGRSGSCARCGRQGSVTTAAVVSDKWTGWSDWRSAVRPALCPGCAWAYREPAHRQGGLLVTTAPSAAALDAVGLAQVLAGATAAPPRDPGPQACAAHRGLGSAQCR